MSYYHYILFDLDGTVSDPGVGITNSVMYALQKFGIQVKERAELYKFIGPPLKDSFMKYYNLSEADAWRAVEYYREYFTEKGMFENVLYEGMEELLKSLSNAGKKIILATSKPEDFASEILEYFKLADYFDVIAGSCLDGTRVKKAEVIQYAIEKVEGFDKKRAIMIGDREHDTIGAKTVGIDSIGVLYGYGDRDELQNAGADYIVEDLMEMVEIILGNAEKHVL